jgi:hypothetical protein
MMTREQQYERYVGEAKELFLKRNAEYGDAFTEAGLLGVACETISIAARLKKKILWDYGEEIIDQHAALNLRDIFLDGINYCTIGLMMIDEANLNGRKK